MYGDVTTEVVFCPNCKENIPKTLYCLNCGYPLYKIEQEREESMEQLQDGVEISQDIIRVQSDEEEPANLEFREMEIEKVDLKAEELVEEYDEELQPTEEPKEEFEAKPIEEIETLIENVEQEPIDEYVEIEEVVEDFEEEVESVVEEESKEEYTEDIDEIIPEPLIQGEKPIEDDKEIVEELKQELSEEAEEIIEDEIEPISEEIQIIEEIPLIFAPDPLTKEVMDNLAKNITLKIRLIRLLHDSQVKEETFVKLFDSYVEQGRIWSSRRDEILGRLNTDTALMEEKIVSAKKNFELLEIRKSIGDADEAEYSVKAPAYKWDIEHLEKEINNSKGGITYVEGIREMVPEAERLELENYYNQDYSSLVHIQGIQDVTLQKIKDVLAETLTLFKT